MTTCYLVYEGRIKCFSCEHYATNAALTRLLSPEKSLNMGHESTELSLYHYGGLQQIHHWTTWFSTAPRHRWIHLQPPERPLKYRTDKSFALASRLVVFLAFVPLEHIESAFEALSMHIAGTYPELMAGFNTGFNTSDIWDEISN